MIWDRRLNRLQAAVLALALLIALFPIFWIVSTSIKPPIDWNASPAIWLPSSPTLSNYLALFDPKALRGEGLGDVSQTATSAVFGSILATLASTTLSILIGLAAAISIVRYRPGGRFTPLMILSGRMFPPAAIAVPFVIIFSLVHLIDSYIGLIAIYVAATLPFSTWMLKSFLEDLPREIEEAAMIDGMTRLEAHLKVTVPLIRGGIVSTMLFIFILNWSEFLFALVLSHSSVDTIPIRLAKYVTATAGTLYGVQAALAVLAMIPLVVAGFAIQSHLARGMTFGAIKR